jgi:hypothetical protein
LKIKCKKINRIWNKVRLQQTIIEITNYEIVEQTLDKATTVKIAKEIAALTDLNSFTFECNTIVDEESVCSLLQNLKNFERLENINVRQNKFTQRIMDALCDGIKHKKELRVSI